MRNKLFIYLVLFITLISGIVAGLKLSQQNQEIRKKAAEVQGSKLSLVGPKQVKVGEKFSVNILLDTTLDPNFTISNVDAVVSVNSNGINPPPDCNKRDCIQYSPPPPDWCKGGQIVTSSPDICGCPQPGRCIMPNDDTNSTSASGLTYKESSQNLIKPMPPIYIIQPISLTGITRGKIFDNYTYPGSSTGLQCGGIAGIKCPDGYYCSYGGTIRADYPDQMGACLPFDILRAGSQGEGYIGTPSSAISSMDDAGIKVCTQDAKQCPNGSWIGRTGSNCEFAPCPTGIIDIGLMPERPPYYYSPLSFIISGAKTYAVDDKGYFKGFVGNGIFATLNFVANQSGNVTISFSPNLPIYRIDDINSGNKNNLNVSGILGYLANQPASAQKPQQRLLTQPQNLQIEVVGIPCTPLPDNCKTDYPNCIATMGLPVGGWCPFPTTGTSCVTKMKGDANCDGNIDGVDYSLWLNSQCIPGPIQKCASNRADFNSDGRVDDADLAIWSKNK